ncbi:MAG: hypothetical protein ACKOW8_10130, partial [Flavobacteriales bacterium]
MRNRSFRRVVTVVILALFAREVSAQLLDNRTGSVFREEMFFSQQFLWTNKISKITGTSSIKQTGMPIIKREDRVVYHFNEVGLMTRMDKVISNWGKVDSLTLEYQRNDTGKVSTIEETGSRGYFTTHFYYDATGKLIRTDYSSVDLGINVPDSARLRGIMLNSETFRWNENTPLLMQKSVYNNYGLHYSNWLIERAEDGYLKSETEELIMSGRALTRKYVYNDHGWIDRVEITDNLGTSMKVHSYTYDEVGNLTRVEYRNGKELTREIQILYTP